MATRAVTSAFYTANFLMYIVTVWYDWNYVEIGHRGYAGKFKFLTFWNLAKSLIPYVFYLCTAAVYTYGMWFNVMFIYWPGRSDSTVWTYFGYGGKFKYLTFWNFILQMVYFGLCVVTIFAGSDTSVTSAATKGHSGLQRARDVIHSTLAFPVGTFVVCTFWALYAMDRELVYPKALDSLIPPWLNHLMFVQVVFWGLFMVDRELIYPERRARLIPPVITHICHTTVLPLLVVEKYLVFHHHPRRRNGIFILVAFALLYLAWILWIAFAANLWVYPVLQVMQNHERAIFIAVLLLFFIGLYILGEALTKALWRKERVTLTSSRQKLK